MLERLTFTGVDGQTDLDGLARLARRYPRVEFGALRGGTTGTARAGPRFPPESVLDRLAQSPVTCALHLCGTHALAAVDGPDRLVSHIVAMVRGFNRVQLNLQGHRDRAFDWTEERIGRLRAFCRAVTRNTPTERVIVQHRGTWDDRPLIAPTAQYLHDVSGGRGHEGLAQWPVPQKNTDEWFGYAGGLGPDNIAAAMTFVHRHRDCRVWLDMESGVPERPLA